MQHPVMAILASGAIGAGRGDAPRADHGRGAEVVAPGAFLAGS